MSKTFKIGITLTKSAIALGLLCAVFCFSAMAQKNPNKSLNENEVRILLSLAKESAMIQVQYHAGGNATDDV